MRAITFLVSAAFLPFALALLTGVVGFAYMGLIPAAVLAYGLLVDPPRGISVGRIVETTKLRVGENARVKVRLRVEKGVGVVFVEDLIPPGLEVIDGSSRHAFFKHLGRPLEVEYQYTVRALKRGRHVLPPVEVIGTGLLQVGEVSYALSSGEDWIDVAPDFVPVGRIPPRKLRTRDNRPPAHISRLGPISTDFKEIREYRPGDPLKFFNWKATARLGKPLVNEYEPEGRIKVMVYLDTTESMGVGTVVNGALESAIGLVLSLTAFLLRSDFRVGLYLVGSGRFETPRTGIQAISTFSKLLLHAGPSISTESLPIAIERSREVLKGGPAITLLITNLTPYNFGDVSKAVREAAKITGGRVIVVDVNPYSQVNGIVGSLAALQKRRLGEELGVRVVHWNPLEEDVPKGLKKVLWVMLREKV